MSSVIGHTLAALTIHHARKPHNTSLPWWPIVLVILAIVPDLDYLISRLRLTGPAPAPDPVSLWLCGWTGATPALGVQTIRVTHSVLGSLFLPFLTTLVLPLLAQTRSERIILSIQAISAGLSHLALDLLVGVTPTALFWPLSSTAIRLPFGILPSAGQILLDNSYLYRNLLIELGVLVPIWLGIYWWRHRYQRTTQHNAFLLILGIVSIGCMIWAAQLER